MIAKSYQQLIDARKFRHYKLENLNQGQTTMNLFDRLAPKQPAPTKEKIKVDPAQKLQRWPKPTVSIRRWVAACRHC